MGVVSLSNYLVFSVFLSANSNYLFNYKHCDWNYVNDSVKMVKFNNQALIRVRFRGDGWLILIRLGAILPLISPP